MSLLRSSSPGAQSAPVPGTGPRQLVAIGASTGGTVAIEWLLRRLPADVPPIVIVQHMLPRFVRPMAERLNQLCPMHVLEATEGEPLRHGAAYIAPAERHLTVRRFGGELRASLTDAPQFQFHRPSVDVLFQSLVVLEGVDIVAVLLTGMGRDGAEGLLALRQAGAQTIAQDEGSSVIFGMPKEAIARGAARHVSSLDELPDRILMCLDQARRPGTMVSR